MTVTISTRAEAGTVSVSPRGAGLLGALLEAAPDPHAASKIVTHKAGISGKLRFRLANRPLTLVRRSTRGGRCIHTGQVPEAGSFRSVAFIQRAVPPPGSVGGHLPSFLGSGPDRQRYRGESLALGVTPPESAKKQESDFPAARYRG